VQLQELLVLQLEHLFQELVQLVLQEFQKLV